jgi:hypothetical protein
MGLFPLFTGLTFEFFSIQDICSDAFLTGLAGVSFFSLGRDRIQARCHGDGRDNDNEVQMRPIYHPDTSRGNSLNQDDRYEKNSVTLSYAVKAPRDGS